MEPSTPKSKVIRYAINFAPETLSRNYASGAPSPALPAVGSLAGAAVKLRFEMANTNIYALQFVLCKYTHFATKRNLNR